MVLLTFQKHFTTVCPHHLQGSMEGRETVLTPRLICENSHSLAKGRTGQTQSLAPGDQPVLLGSGLGGPLLNPTFSI